MKSPGRKQGNVLKRVLGLLAFATSIVVATEFIVVGLLPVLARDLSVSIGEAGRLTGAFALSAAVLGPPLTLLVSSKSPKRVMVATLLLFAAGNLVAVWSPRYLVMLVVRAMQGAALPVFISVGTGVVSALAGEERRGRTLAQANWGFVIGILGALPVGVALAQGDHWQMPLLALSAFAVAAAFVLAIWFPPTNTQLPRIHEQAVLLFQGSFLWQLALTVTAFSTIFAVYTYQSAWLTEAVGSDLAVRQDKGDPAVRVQHHTMC